MRYLSLSLKLNSKLNFNQGKLDCTLKRQRNFVHLFML